MRKLLHLAARSVVTHQEDFRAYYLRQLKEGKPKKLVLNHVANKLIQLICAILRANKSFIEHDQPVQPLFLQKSG